MLICGTAARDLRQHDPSQIVMDEFAAFPLGFLWVPLSVWSGVAGFIWFRLFDILKPWPVRRLENLPGGWGVMADDVAAAVCAGAMLWLRSYRPFSFPAGAITGRFSTGMKG